MRIKKNVKKITFLNPPLSLEGLYNELGASGSELPPLGLAIMAATTRQAGYETKVIDAIALKMGVRDTVDAIVKQSPDVVGITATIMAIYQADEVAQMVKKRLPRAIVVIGGPHFTAVPEETMRRFHSFDIGVLGEGEDTFVELLHKLGSNLQNVKGLYLRHNRDIKFTGKRPPIMDLDRIPFPAWDLLPNLVKYYQPAADSLNRAPATLLITSRGCTGQCLFCDRSVFGNLCRCHSADYVIKMIKLLQQEYGIRELFIEDDNFLLFKSRLKEICKRIIEEKIDITWSCMARVDTIDDEMLLLLKKAGCWQINFGCESGSQKILDILNKGVTVRQVEDAIRLVRKHGIKVKGLFMLGNFGETRETIQETLDFIKRVPLTDFHMTCFTPLPGAAAYELAHKYGTFDPDWKKANMFNATNFVPNGLTKDEIDYYYKKAWRAFYLRPRIILYYATKLREPALRKKLFLGGIAFLKFILKGNTNEK
ncbi:MAG TPA: radical SAM protein [Nanoarchaeota archaeon]|nr:radical SAM protein [Nanoarchaeota archaeon]